MKKVLLLALAALLLCSCRRGPEAPDHTETEPDTTVTEAVTADAELILSAAGFRSVRDEALGAYRVIPDDPAGGLSAYLVVYGPDKVSLRVTLEGGGVLECGGKSREITNGDALADEELMSLLRGAASGAPAEAGGRPVTEKERETAGRVLALYDAAYGEPYTIEKKDPDETVLTKICEDGSKMYECGGYSIRFPASFEAELTDGVLIIVSDNRRLRTVSVSYSKTQFNVNLADPDAAEASVASAGGTLISPPEETRVGGSPAYRMSFEKSGVFITQYFVDGGGGTYILTGASYDGNDDIPKNIISTFKVKA